jgi:uncharacterized protein (DUF305 family)
MRAKDFTLGAAIAIAWTLNGLGPAQADEPGRGLTAHFEQDYLKFIIDHHYAALRMTELAAGTDLQREAAISPTEGTSPTPSKASTQPKALSNDIKSMARSANRMQREEILTARQFLQQWYGINYQPHVRGMNQAQIALLERAPTGASFDHLFMEVFSRHHYTALGPSTQCEVASEITHDRLHRYCSGIVHMQINDIQNMREMLCDQFNVCDYQPLVGLKGRHSGSEGNQYLDAAADSSD